MRKVKYTPKDIYDKFLTPGKVYDVISITKIKKAKYLKCYIENDIGYIRNFFFLMIVITLGKMLPQNIETI